ncbi:hypothetical protein JOM56_002300 [Amanita muscaria]
MVVNNDNHHLTLRKIDKYSIDERVKYMTSEKSPHAAVMDAVTALLVQDSEVLASMACTSTSIVTFRAPSVAEDVIRQQISTAMGGLQQALLGYGEHLTDTNVHEVQAFPIGKSYWGDIEKASSGFIFPESGFNAYLNRFKEQSYYNRSLLSLSPQFSEYIVSACWQKMEQWIGHWSAVGLLHQLSKISEHFLRSQVNFNPKSPIELDPKLRTYLQVLILQNPATF